MSLLLYAWLYFNIFPDQVIETYSFEFDFWTNIHG